MKTVRIIFICLLCFCVAVTVGFTNFKKDAISEVTNSKLPEINITSETGLHDIFMQVTDYFNARIGFHDGALNAYQVLNDKLFGEMVHPSYCYGQEGYVFFKMVKNDPDKTFILEFVKYLSRIQKYCDDRDVPFIYVITPSKTTVYNQYLPKGYNYHNIYLETLCKYLKEYNINYVDNAAYLTELAKTKQIFNKKHDAGHWNDLGEFYGTNNIIEKVREYFPSQPLLKESDFDITEKVETSLPVSKFPIRETVPNFTYRNAPNVIDRTGAYDGIVLDYQHRTFKVTASDRQTENAPNVLFFHGSYFNRNRDMYNFIFNQDYAVHNYENVLNFDYYFNIFQPDCVIFESAEYATDVNYFNLGKMSSKILNDPLNTQDISKAQKIEIRDGKTNQNNISNLVVSKVRDDNQLVTLSATTDKTYSYGYYVCNDKEFDLSIDGKQISVTVDKTNCNLENGTLYLF